MGKTTLCSRVQLATVASLAMIAMTALIRLGLEPLAFIPAVLTVFLMRRLLTRHWAVLGQEEESEDEQENAGYVPLWDRPLARRVKKRGACLCVAYVCMLAGSATVQACLAHAGRVNDAAVVTDSSKAYSVSSDEDERTWDRFVADVASLYGDTKYLVCITFLVAFCIVGSVIALPPLNGNESSKRGVGREVL